ncbi:hypothetical protein ACJQWK_02092 [Exserohilum turcicum]
MAEAQDGWGCSARPSYASPVQCQQLPASTSRREHVVRGGVPPLCHDNDKAIVAVRQAPVRAAWPGGLPLPLVTCVDNTARHYRATLCVRRGGSACVHHQRAAHQKTARPASPPGQGSLAVHAAGGV